MTARKAAAKKGSAVARQAEAEEGFAVVEHYGVTLRIPIGDNIPAAVVDIYIDNPPNANRLAIRKLVGQEQWQLLTDAGMPERGVSELDAKITELLGN